MKDKLLSVYVNDKEVYYVKQVEKEADTYGNTKAYAVFDSNDNLIHVYTLDVNAFIEAIQNGKIDGKGYCVAHYIEEKEKLIFEDYRLRLRISAVSRV